MLKAIAKEILSYWKYLMLMFCGGILILYCFLPVGYILQYSLISQIYFNSTYFVLPLGLLIVLISTFVIIIKIFMSGIRWLNSKDEYLIKD